MDNWSCANFVMQQAEMKLGTTTLEELMRLFHKADSASDQDVENFSNELTSNFLTIVAALEKQGAEIACLREQVKGMEKGLDAEIAPTKYVDDPPEKQREFDADIPNLPIEGEK